MRVLVVSEGEHEQSGALENLLKRLGGQNATFDVDRVSNNRIHALHGKGDGYFKRAVRWLLEAQKRGAEALVFLIDEDGRKERVTQIRNAQVSTLSALPRALGVAIRMFDAWMLADEGALTEVLGYQVNRQPDPETIRDPKTACQDLLGKSSAGLAQREMYAQVAGRASLDILSERCPGGFAPFATNVRAIFATSPGA
jgi:hypothetical protein